MPVRYRGQPPVADRPERVRLDKPDLPQGYASEHWDRVHPLLSGMGVLRPIDRPALESLYLWWHEYRSLQETPATDSGETYKRSISLASCFKNWSNLAARFGLTPKDWEKLTLDPPETDDPAADFVR